MKRKDILSNYGGLIREIQNKSINEIKSIEENSTSQIEQIKAQTISLTNQKNNLDSEIKKIGGKSVDIPQIDQNVIKRIRTSYAKRIQPLEKDLTNINNQLLNISNKSSGLSSIALKELTAKIDTKREELSALNKKKNEVIAETRDLYKNNIKKLEVDQAEELKQINNAQIILKDLEIKED